MWGFTGVIGFSGVSSEFKHITPTMENHMGKKLDNENGNWYYTVGY